MSVVGTKQTCLSRRSMSAYWGKADSRLTFPECPVLTPSGHLGLSPDLRSSKGFWSPGVVTDRAMKAWYNPSIA